MTTPRSAVLAAALGVWPTGLAAQGRLVVRGVVSSDSAAVAYASVELGAGRRIFADASGAFVFPNVPPGNYRLSVRQVGYAPLDTTVNADSSAATILIALHHLPVRLRAIAVSADPRCHAGLGGGDDGNADLPIILAQLFENARRYQLLADEYPFVYRMERAASEIGAQENTTWQGIDTITVRSDERLKYEPGRIFRPGLGPRGRPARVVQVPQLADLADSTFSARHCFRYAGETALDGVAAVLVAFDARRPLLSFDVEGEAWLDARSWRLLRVGVRVVPADALPDLLSIEVVADFREIQPNVLVPRRIFTLTRTAGFRRRPLGRQEEEQRLLTVHFLRPLGGLP